jgi:hypothetical protein
VTLDEGGLACYKQYKQQEGLERNGKKGRNRRKFRTRTDTTVADENQLELGSLRVSLQGGKIQIQR